MRKGVKEALDRVEEFQPHVVKRPVLMQVEFERPLIAEYAANISLARRVDIKTVSFKAKDVVEAFNVFRVMNKIASYAKSEGPL